MVGRQLHQSPQMGTVYVRSRDEFKNVSTGGTPAVGGHMRRVLLGLAGGAVIAAVVAWAVPDIRLRATGWAAGDPIAEGEPARYWAYLARTGGTEDKTKAMRLLGDLKGAAPPGTADVLAAGLSDPDKAVRRTAAYALSAVPGGAEHADRLVAATGDGEIEVRAAAIIALGNLRAGGADAVKTLTRMATDDPSGSNRVAALTCLARYGPLAEPAIPVMIAALPQPDGPAGSPQQSAVAGLVGIGPPAVPPLIAGLDHPTPTGRQGAIKALTRLGPVAAPALPELRRRAGPDEPDPVTRLLAAKALATIEGRPAGALAAARVALTAPNPDRSAREELQLTAIGVLGDLGPDARDALPDVLAVLATDTNYNIRRYAALAAVKIDRGDAVRAALTKATKDDQPEVCHAARLALQTLDGK